MVSVVVLGCNPAAPPQQSPRQVGWSALVSEFRDNPTADADYRDRRISVFLPSGAYQSVPHGIEAYHAVPGVGGVLVFECDPPPGDNSWPLLVTGTCRGRIIDGIERANRINWWIRVDSCLVAVLSR